MQYLLRVSLAVAVLTLLGTVTLVPAKADVAEARRLMAEAMQPPSSFDAPGPAFDAREASGKTLWYISFSEASPVMATWSGTMKRLVEGYGATVNIIDGKSDFSEFGRSIEQAVANNADAILLMGIPPEAFSVQVGAAADAEIPVIVGSNGRSAFPNSPGVVAATSIDHIGVGKRLAAWMVAHSEGQANAVVVTHDEVMGTKELVDSIHDETKRLCPACTVNVENLPFARIQTEGEVTQSLAVRDPDLSYIIPVYDFETLTMIPALEQVGASDRVHLASFNAISAVMENLAKGKIHADVGAPNVWFGFAIADQVLRILSGSGPIADIKVPLRLFTADNIGDLDLAAGEQTWYGNLDFASEYKKLWGDP